MPRGDGRGAARGAGAWHAQGAGWNRWLLQSWRFPESGGWAVPGRCRNSHVLRATRLRPHGSRQQSIALVNTQAYDTSTVPVSAPEARAVLCRMTGLDVETCTLMVQRDIPCRRFRRSDAWIRRARTSPGAGRSTAPPAARQTPARASVEGAKPRLKMARWNDALVVVPATARASAGRPITRTVQHESQALSSRFPRPVRRSATGPDAGSRCPHPGAADGCTPRRAPRTARGRRPSGRRPTARRGPRPWTACSS